MDSTNDSLLRNARFLRLWIGQGTSFVGDAVSMVALLVLVVSDLARAVLVLGLVFARDLATIYVLVFLMGLARTVFNPTVRAAFPSVVGGGDLIRANALIAGTFSTSIMVGPALGGLLVATVGVDAAFMLDAVTYLVSAAMLALTPLARPQRKDEEDALSEDLKAGFVYLAGSGVPLAIV